MTVQNFVGMVLYILEMHFSRLKYFYSALGTALVLLVVAACLALFSAPPGFPTGTYITIDSGTSVGLAASELRQQHAISSRLLFKVLYRFIPNVHGVQSGTYVFEEPVGILTVLWNITHGISGIPRIKVTFPEGTTVRQMGAALAKVIPEFNEQKFDSLALGRADSYEGYLFPDTYFFLPETTEVDAVQIMHDNYLTRTKALYAEHTSFGKAEREVVTMASILEGEGKTLEDKRVIAGILWHRIAIGMALQVDATFGYSYGQTGYVPTQADLTGNSAYNTYRMKGLPPTPINNPGLVSLQAALTPTASNYLYYLTGDDRQMHYAKTFAEHIANQKKYLK